MTTRWMVQDVMTTEVVTVRPRTPYRELLQSLAENRVSAVPVVDDDRHVLGIVSEADLLHRLEFAGVHPHARMLESSRHRSNRMRAEAEFAGDLMTTPAMVTNPAASIRGAARLMEHERVKQLPVVDLERHLVGIVSRRDLLHVFDRSDESLRDEVVEEVLHRTLWLEPGVLDVTVAAGVVTVGGAVPLRSTMAIAVRLVEAVPGVVEVVDNLTYHYDDRSRPGQHSGGFPRALAG